MKHKYEYTLSNGSRLVLETDARYKEALREASRMAFEQGAEILTFTQVK